MLAHFKIAVSLLLVYFGFFMNNKKFASRVVLLVLTNLLVKFIWLFFIERKLQLKVGFEAFGVYANFINFTLILSVINDPGLNNYLIQYLSYSKSHQQQLTEIFYIKLLLSAVYVIATFFLATALNFDNYYLLGLIVGYQVLLSFLNYCRAFLKGHQLLNTEICFSVLDKIFLIIFFLPMLYFSTGFKWTIHFYLVGQIIAILFALILCAYYLYKNDISVVVKGKFAVNFLIIRKIVPFAVFAFLVLAYNKIDTVMLTYLLPNGALETGIYVAAYRFLDAGTMLPILFATLFYPVVCKLIAHKTKVNEMVQNSMSVLLPSTLIIAMSSWFFRHQLMQFFYAEQFSEKLSLIFGLLMFCLPLTVLYYVYSTYFTANNSLKTLNLVSAGGLITNFILNLFLIPVYQSLGAAISSLISFLLVGLMYVLLFYIRFKFPFPTRLGFKIAFFLFILGLLGELLPYFTTVNWTIILGLYLLSAVIIAFLFNFIRLKNIREIVSLKL